MTDDRYEEYLLREKKKKDEYREYLIREEGIISGRELRLRVAEWEIKEYTRERGIRRAAYKERLEKDYPDDAFRINKKLSEWDCLASWWAMKLDREFMSALAA